MSRAPTPSARDLLFAVDVAPGFSPASVPPSRGWLDAEDFYERADGIRRLLQSGVFVGGELHFDDLFGAALSQLYRDAHEKPVDSVFPLEIDGAGQDLFLVFQNRFNHLHDGGRGRVVVRQSADRARHDRDDEA